MIKKYWAIIVTLMIAVWVSSDWIKPAYSGKLNWDTLASYPILHGGRTKPVDSLARQSLLTLYGKQKLKIDNQKMPAIEWFFELISIPEKANDRKIFRVDHPGILNLIDRRIESGKYVSYNELKKIRSLLMKQASQIQEKEAQHRNAYERAVINCASRIKRYESLQKMTSIFPIPENNSWVRLVDSIVRNLENGKRPELALDYIGITNAIKSGNYTEGNKHIKNMEILIEDIKPETINKAKIEKKANQTQLFYKAMQLYLIVFVLILLSWMKYSWLREKAYPILTSAFTIHSVGIVLRMWLHSRPPVTNLYASAVFVGWTAIMLCIFTEKRFKNGVGQLVAGGIGFLTLIIAHHLAIQGDTLDMMQAVLDSNFWLATHVITINMGYAGAIVMGVIAHVYIIKRLRTHTLEAGWEKSLSQMAFGALCFGILFMVIGTLLGGIWADQSWGRFWGWDPKENGALLIILVQAIILHARWGGMIKVRGMMVLAVVTNMVTAFSWFGVNMLGVGLHSYGFMDQAFFWLILFIISQLFVVWMAFFPTQKRNI